MLSRETKFGLFSALLTLTTLASLVAPNAAFAQMAGRVTAGGLTYTLTDLDPLDGIAPSLVFMPMPTVFDPGEEIYPPRLIHSYRDGSASDSFIAFGAGTTDLAHTDHPSDNLFSNAIMRGREQPLSHEIEIEAFARSNGTSESNIFTDLSTGAMKFLLSPNTAVGFDLNVNGNLTNGPGSSNFYYLSSWMYLLTGGNPYVESDETNIISYAFNATEPAISISQILNVSTSNRTTNFVGGQVWFDMGLQVGAAPLQAIPEPASLTMLACGLAILGAARRRAPHQ